MFLTNEDIRKIKKAELTTIDGGVTQDKTIIIIPNRNSTKSAAHLIDSITNLQYENPKNITIYLLNYELSGKEKNIFDNTQIFNRAINIHTDKIYSEAKEIIFNNEDAKILWLNPNIEIQPTFIQRMRNVKEKTLVRPLYWYWNTDWVFGSWGDVLAEIERFVGIDGMYAWAAHCSDLCRIKDLMGGKNINWCKFLYKLKNNKIKNFYFEDRILVKNHDSFFNLEEY